MKIEQHLSNFIVNDNIFRADCGYPANSYGIYVASGSSDFYTIMRNVVVGSIVDNIYDGGTGSHKISSDTNNVVDF